MKNCRELNMVPISDWLIISLWSEGVWDNMAPKQLPDLIRFWEDYELLTKFFPADETSLFQTVCDIFENVRNVCCAP